MSSKIRTKSNSRKKFGLQLIYSKLYAKRIIGLKDVQEIIGDYNLSKNYACLLNKKGLLQRIRPGIYAVVSPDAIGNEFTADKYLVASKITKKYFLSHHTALELHGIANSACNTAYISVNKYFTPIEYKENYFQPVLTKHFFGVKKKPYLNTKIQVSDIEKTILDCIRKPDYSGGFEEIYKSMSMIASLNFQILLTYLKRFEEQHLYNKVGFVLSLLKENKSINFETSIREEYLEKLKAKLSKTIYYWDKSKESKFVKEWNLMVPKTFFKQIKGV